MHAVQNNTSCHHCGGKCATSSPQKDGHQFCCQGCLSVYELLTQYDSCEYYELGPASGMRPPEVKTSKYSVLDTSPERSHVIEYEDDLILRARFVLPSMHCASCVWLLERLHRFDSSILSSRVDLLRHTVVVECDRAHTTLANVALLLASLGYEPEIDRTDNDRRSAESRSRRTLYLRLGVAGFAAGNVMMIGLANYVAGKDGFDATLKIIFDVLSIGLSIPVLLYSAQPWLSSAVMSMRRGIVNLDVPVALGITTIFLRSCYEIVTSTSEGFLDSFTGLVFFLLIGKLFQQRAFASIDFHRTMRSFFPLSATKQTDGQQQQVHIDEIAVGDVVVVRNGEVIPADAILLHEPGVVDYSYVTGESTPIECAPGKMLFAGGRVMGRSLTLSVIKPASISYMASLWTRSDVHTERREYGSTSDRFGLIFTVVTISIAVVGGLLWLPDVSMALTVATSVLIIACPCAFTLSAPIVYGTAMSNLARSGIYLRTAAIIADLQRISAVVVDKTGTLTEPTSVTYHGTPLNPEVVSFISALALQSSHPVSQAIARVLPSSSASVSDVLETPGVGISGVCGDLSVALMAEKAQPARTGFNGRTYVHVGDEVMGYFLLDHALRPEAASMIMQLQKDYDVRLLTGDTAPISKEIAQLFPAEAIKQGASPSQKVEYIVKNQKLGSKVLMMGDGLNDLAALSAANVSVAVSNNTSRIVPACDIVIDAKNIGSIASLLRYAHKLRGVVGLAFWFTMIYNLIGLTLSLSGNLSPVITAIMMPLSSLLVLAISVVGSKVTHRSLPWA